MEVRVAVIDEALFQSFIQLITARTGLHIREQDRGSLKQKLIARMQALKIAHPTQYYQLLEQSVQGSESGSTASEREWQNLSLVLTTGESYFFRDHGQFRLLRQQILPSLIEHQRSRLNPLTKPSLRIWSAGCSTGEEAYSLAVLVYELLGSELSDWNVLILGTDLNTASIARARQGLYSSWSFRTVDPDLQSRYFHKRQQDWEIDLRIRLMVTFQIGNLMTDSFPNPMTNLYGMDLILCRNVFIYFNPTTISAVLRKFSSTLKIGGYLVTGHAELQGCALSGLQTRLFSESVIYQRGELPALISGNTGIVAVPPTSQEATSPAASVKPVLSVPPILAAAPLVPVMPPVTLPAPPPDLLESAQQLFRTGAYEQAIRKAEQVLHQNPKRFDAYYLIAQSQANLGRHAEAIQSCQQALLLDPTAAAPYQLMASVAEEQGEIEMAKSLLKKVIYLHPGTITAYLELALLYDREGDVSRAQKMRTTALELLKQLPPDAVVDQQSELKAGTLLAHLQSSS